MFPLSLNSSYSKPVLANVVIRGCYKIDTRAINRAAKQLKRARLKHVVGINEYQICTLRICYTYITSTRKTTILLMNYFKQRITSCKII